MTFGEFLKQQREAKDWKQPEAAEKIAIEQSYLSKLENNKAIPSPDVFDRLLKVYQFSIQQISEQVQSSELEKLKDIVVIREFIVSTQQRRDKDKRRFLVVGTVASMLGAFLLALGIATKGHVRLDYIYESKGVVKDSESIYTFSPMPYHREFARKMSTERSREQLKKKALFNRLDYKQVTSTEDKGAFYDQKVEGGTRRFHQVDSRIKTSVMPFYLGVSFGVMFLVGGLNLFYVSRRW